MLCEYLQLTWAGFAQLIQIFDFFRRHSAVVVSDLVEPAVERRLSWTARAEEQGRVHKFVEWRRCAMGFRFSVDVESQILAGPESTQCDTRRQAARRSRSSNSPIRDDNVA